MKTLLKSTMLIAAFAMPLYSCQKTEGVPQEGHKLIVHASEAQTKTHLDSDYNVIWDEGETMQIFCMQSSDSAPVSAVSDKAVLSNGNTEADFSFTISGMDEFTNFIYGGVYPVSAIGNAGNDKNVLSGKYKIALPNVQSPSTDAYDPDAFILIAKPQTFSESQTEIVQYFRKAAALNDITLTNCAVNDERISSVKITLPEDKYFAGRKFIDLTTGIVGDYTSDAYSFNTITLNYAEPFTVSDSKMNVWFTSWDVEFSSGTMTVEIDTDKATYTREIAISKSISFKEGKYNLLTVDMSSAARVAKSDAPDYSGEWLIVNSDKTYACQKYSTGNNIKAFAVTVKADGCIDEIDGIADCKMTLTKIESGDYAGLYTIQDAAGNYLYAASSSGNQLKGSSASPTVDSYWEIKDTEKDGIESWSIVASKSSNRNVMQYNQSASCFSCYSSASQTAVALLSYSSVKVDTTPMLSADDITGISADGVADASATITIKNIETVTATPDGTVVTSASVSGSTLTYTVSANETSETREGSIILSADGVEDVTMKVFQKAAGTESGAKTVDFVVGIDKSSSTSIAKNGVTMSFSSGTLSRTDNYRLYASGSMTITVESGNITEIVVESSQHNLSGTGYDTSTKTWTGKSSSVKLTTSKQSRIEKISVTYVD